MSAEDPLVPFACDAVVGSVAVADVVYDFSYCDGSVGCGPVVGFGLLHVCGSFAWDWVWCCGSDCGAVYSVWADLFGATSGWYLLGRCGMKVAWYSLLVIGP